MKAIKKITLLLASVVIPFSASAADERTTTGTPATIGSNNGLGTFNPSDSIKLGGAHDLLSNPEVGEVGAVNVFGNSNKSLSIAHTMKIGSIGDSTNSGAVINIIINNSIDVTLTGISSGGSAVGINDYSALGQFNFNNNDRTLNIDAPGVEFSGSFTGGTNGTGTINVKQNNVTFSAVFDATNRVKDMILDSGAGNRELIIDTDLYLFNKLYLGAVALPVIGDGPSQSYNGSTVRFKTGRSIHASSINLRDEESDNLIFEHNTTLDASVDTNVTAGGTTITFEGASNIYKSIYVGNQGEKPNNSQVNFTSDTPSHRSSLNSQIHSDQINIGGSTMGVDAGSVGFFGDVTSNQTTFDLGLENLTFGRHGNNNSATFKGNQVYNTTFDGKGGGHLIAESSDLNMSGLTKVTINLTDNSTVPGPEGRQYTLFAELTSVGEEFDDGTVVLPNSDIVQLNTEPKPLVKWTYEAGVLKQALVDNPDEVVINSVPSVTNIPQILNSSARNDLLTTVNDGGSTTQLVAALNPDALALGTEPANQAAENATQVIGLTTRNLDARVSGFQVVSTDDGLKSGISAGDNSKYGLWAVPFAGSIVQKNRGVNPGYVSHYHGSTFGFDTAISDDMTLGSAITLIKNIVNHKNSNLGDKTVIQTAVLSVYGLKSLTNNLFVQVVASLGASKIDNKENRFTTPNFSVARADYNSMSYTVEAIGGYSYFINPNTALIPILGFAYTGLNKIDYQETGAGTQNLSVTRGYLNKVELIAGLRLSHSVEINDFMFSPSIHGYARYDVVNKGLNVKAALAGLNGGSTNLEPKTAKQVRDSYFIGCSFDIEKSTFEYGFSYDLRLARKYVGHQGAIRLKLNF